jgi:hypothetical protein
MRSPSFSRCVPSRAMTNSPRSVGRLSVAIVDALDWEDSH